MKNFLIISAFLFSILATLATSSTAFAGPSHITVAIRHTCIMANVKNYPQTSRSCSSARINKPGIHYKIVCAGSNYNITFKTQNCGKAVIKGTNWTSGAFDQNWHHTSDCSGKNCKRTKFNGDNTFAFDLFM
jgi:hypothetical protein